MWRAFAISINTLLLGAALFVTAQFSLQGDNATRVRNALIADVGAAEDFAWPPESPPPSFLLEIEPPPQEISAIASMVLERAGGAQSMDDFEKALAISRHIAANKGNGEAIQSSTLATYEQIMAGRGYCADFSQVFMALSLASGVPAREWGFGWEAFGAGHAFNEIYDETREKWLLIDSFNSMYFVDTRTETPLSANEVQAQYRLEPAQRHFRVVPILPERFAFDSVERAMRYYELGVDQFYLFWGNNVFSYDSDPIVGVLRGLARPVEVAGSIAVGVHPRIRIPATGTNRGHIEELLRTRSTFLVYVAIAGLLAITLVAQLVSWWRTRR
jgi:hypothetical protein